MKEKKSLNVPHSLAIIFFVMLIAAALTYLIPAGSFERVKNEAGKTMVVAGSFHYIERSPVNPLSILNYVYAGLDSARSIIFALLCAGGGLGIVLESGMFQGASRDTQPKGKGERMVCDRIFDDNICTSLYPNQPELLYTIRAFGHRHCHGNGL